VRPKQEFERNEVVAHPWLLRTVMMAPDHGRGTRFAGRSQAKAATGPGPLPEMNLYSLSSPAFSARNFLDSFPSKLMLTRISEPWGATALIRPTP
jgi:hypothetical protein